MYIHKHKLTIFRENYRGIASYKKGIINQCLQLLNKLLHCGSSVFILKKLSNYYFGPFFILFLYLNCYLAPFPLLDNDFGVNEYVRHCRFISNSIKFCTTWTVFMYCVPTSSNKYFIYIMLFIKLMQISCK